MKNIKEKVAEGIYLEFIPSDTEGKYAFTSENKILQQWISGVSRKKVKPSQFHFVVAAVKEFLSKGIIPEKIEFESNPIVTLAHCCQQKWGANIEAKVVEKQGFAHCPIVTVCITLPNGKKYEASESNKRKAKQIAANNALLDLGIN